MGESVSEEEKRENVENGEGGRGDSRVLVEMGNGNPRFETRKEGRNV
jgi:hypothetical protein